MILGGVRCLGVGLCPFGAEAAKSHATTNLHGARGLFGIVSCPEFVAMEALYHVRKIYRGILRCVITAIACLLTTTSFALTSSPTILPTVTPTLLMEARCDSVNVTDSLITSIEGGETVCFPVDAPGDCCWTSSVDAPGLIFLLTPEVQCGDHQVCLSITPCDCSGCSETFRVFVADRTVQVACVNQTPTPPLSTPTPDPLTPSASPTATHPICTGDCDDNRQVTVDELLNGTLMATGEYLLSVCPPFDRDGSGFITVDEIVDAINNALDGCP